MTSTSSFPLIKTNRLELAPLLDSDAAEVFALFSDARIVEFYDLEAFTTMDEADAWIKKHRIRFEKGEGIRWGIRYKGMSKLLGTCGFNDLAGVIDSGEIGYDVRPEYWGDGIGTEAVQAIVAWGFSTGLNRPLHRIVARTMLNNDASIRLLQKIGFQEERIAKQGGHWKGAFHDLRIFVLLSEKKR